MSYHISTILRLFVFLLLSLTFFQCKNDTAAREQALEAAQEDAANSKESKPLATESTRPPVVGSLPLSISNASIAKDEVACVSVSATHFNEIVSMQYTIKWDPAMLKFTEVKGFGLPSLNAQNFGARAADKGILAYSWYDPNVQGISVPDGKSLYDICFEAIGGSGSSSTVEFADSPVVIEISNSASQFLDIAAKNGLVKID